MLVFVHGLMPCVVFTIKMSQKLIKTYSVYFYEFVGGFLAIVYRGNHSKRHNQCSNRLFFKCLNVSCNLRL